MFILVTLLNSTDIFYFFDFISFVPLCFRFAFFSPSLHSLLSLPLSPSIYLSIYLFIYQSICLSLFLNFFPALSPPLFLTLFDQLLVLIRPQPLSLRGDRVYAGYESVKILLCFNRVNIYERSVVGKWQFQFLFLENEINAETYIDTQ